MRSTHQYLMAACGFALLAAVAACGRDLTGAAAAGRTSVALHSVAAPAAAGPLTNDGDHDGHGMRGFGRIGKADIDSLTVNVTKVEVKAEMPDPENAADSAAEARADRGKHEDGDRGDDHENDERTWVSLDVTAGGHLNLLKLPDSASGGLTIATGTLAPGPYRHVRLFVTDATIFLKTPIVTPAGDTLQAGVGLPVIIPSADSTGAAIKTDERFVVPSGGGTVQLYFDADDTIRHVVVAGDGKIIVPPVIR